jgi:hypothetical protein
MDSFSQKFLTILKVLGYHSDPKPFIMQFKSLRLKRYPGDGKKIKLIYRNIGEENNIELDEFPKS